MRKREQKLSSGHYKEPVAEILELLERDNVTACVVQLDRVLGSDSFLAPAALYSLQEPAQERLQLHKLVDRVEKTLRFESYNLKPPLPSKGDKFIFRAWWRSDALALVKDTSLIWTRERYPDNGKHEHCPLTYKTISAYTGEREGYRCGKTWITVDAYERFIRDDILRLRGKR